MRVQLLFAIAALEALSLCPPLLLPSSPSSSEELAFPGPRSPTPNFYSPPNHNTPNLRGGGGSAHGNVGPQEILPRWRSSHRRMREGRGGNRAVRSVRWAKASIPSIMAMSRHGVGVLSRVTKEFSGSGLLGGQSQLQTQTLFSWERVRARPVTGVPGLAQDRHEKGGRYE